MWLASGAWCMACAWAGKQLGSRSRDDMADDKEANTGVLLAKGWKPATRQEVVQERRSPKIITNNF